MKKSNHKNKYSTSDTLGQRASDRVTTFVGSWKFLIGQTIIVILWITLNAVAVINHWDKYPFIFLNLLLGIQAAYTAPVIMMSQNRELERDRQKSALDLATDRKAEREIEEIQKRLEKIDREKLSRILEILEAKK